MFCVEYKVVFLKKKTKDSKSYVEYKDNKKNLLKNHYVKIGAIKSVRYF